ncbi:unnamed protein product [Didymodactylos carnosus]|uniref:G-protein coupled receptors family 1 profile domain-containing protein n=1 Tax=Didymodactylos carnosus TaxID=1234261 RepID=A0A815GYA0_9BILA|nr:unnamed protein product [Didymodactylos carnosus]CAF1344523.1 unnamed protein product [Didymodactylos carnosus]CAF4016855.1 unnamed protein product [Didymodactylos carnosus]CAF4208878.1 unnamed protein product [Didymodactylos carnosus]
MDSNQTVDQNITLLLKYSLTFLNLKDLKTYEIIILISYAFMIGLSFFTNLIAILVFMLGRRSRTALSPFLLNLSVFNIIMTVYCIPFTITSVIFQRWLYPKYLCIILESLKMFSVSGVLLTLITIAIDRYCVVKYPLECKLYPVKKRNSIALIIIWIVSLLIAICWFPARSQPLDEKRVWVSSRISYENFINSLNDSSIQSHTYDYVLITFDYRIVNTIQCVPNKAKNSDEVRRTILTSIQTYFIPLFILAFVYLRISAILWRRSNNSTPSKHAYIHSHNDAQFKKKLKQGIKMLVIVIILYASLWLPMNAFQLCLNIFCYPENPYHFCNNMLLLQLLYIGCHYLTVSNTAINPIIYGFTNKKFRSDIKQLRYRLLQFHTPQTFTRNRFPPENPENCRLNTRSKQDYAVSNKLYSFMPNRETPVTICTYVSKSRTKENASDTIALAQRPIQTHSH